MADTRIVVIASVTSLVVGVGFLANYFISDLSAYFLLLGVLVAGGGLYGLVSIVRRRKGGLEMQAGLKDGDP